MMSDPIAVVQKIGDFVWGPFLLIPLLLLVYLGLMGFAHHVRAGREV